MFEAYPRKHTEVTRSLALRLRGTTNRDVISDDGINYWETADGQLFTVLINISIAFEYCFQI